MTEAELKKFRKEFVGLTQFVKDYLVLLDHYMKQPESPERGKRIAALSNKLEMKNDMVRRFTLEIDFNGNPLKRKKLSVNPVSVEGA